MKRRKYMRPVRKKRTFSDIPYEEEDEQAEIGQPDDTIVN